MRTNGPRIAFEAFPRMTRQAVVSWVMLVACLLLLSVIPLHTSVADTALISAEGTAQTGAEHLADLTQRANREDAVAQDRLGDIYQKGEIVERDYRTAVYWYKKSARKGYAPAQRHLGSAYRSGHGVEQDFKKALYWYRRAASNGDLAAQFNLGQMYRLGLGTDPKPGEAARWYRLAAERGDAEAQNNLAYLYANGEGVERNLIIAYAWFHVAESQGLAHADGNKHLIALELTQEQLDQAIQLAHRYAEEYIVSGEKPVKEAQ